MFSLKSLSAYITLDLGMSMAWHNQHNYMYEHTTMDAVAKATSCAWSAFVEKAYDFQHRKKSCCLGREPGGLLMLHILDFIRVQIDILWWREICWSLGEKISYICAMMIYMPHAWWEHLRIANTCTIMNLREQIRNKMWTMQQLIIAWSYLLMLFISFHVCHAWLKRFVFSTFIICKVFFIISKFIYNFQVSLIYKELTINQ